MNRKRLTRDQKWFFQSFPYYQMRIENNLFTGLVSLIQLTDEEYRYWEYERAGKVAVAGKGMVWLQMIPDNGSRAITTMFLPDKRVSAWYVDVIEEAAYDADGVAVFVDKYLDVIFTPQGDVVIDDRDELDAAFRSGELTEEQYKAALREGEAIVDELCSDIPAAEKWCRNILDMVEEKVGAKQFVIFLDVDGVLDVFNPHVHIQEIMPEAVERLRRLVTRTNARIVAISDRRLWDKALKTRTAEIAAYLESNPQIYNYVILDDCYGDDYSSDPKIQSHLVHINAMKGLQDSDMIKACEIMNRLDLQKW